MLLYRLRLRKQRLPPGQDLLGPLDNAEPQLPRHVPVGAEVQQRLLPDPAVDADVAHQAVGLAGLSGLVGVGLGRLDEHCRLRCRPLGRLAGRGGGGKGMWPESEHGPTRRKAVPCVGCLSQKPTHMLSKLCDNRCIHESRS